MSYNKNNKLIPTNKTTNNINFESDKFNKILAQKNNILYKSDIYFEINSNMNDDFSNIINGQNFYNKKEILNDNNTENVENFFPYITPVLPPHIFAVKLSSLSLDYDKYIKFIDQKEQKIQYIYTYFSACIEVILTSTQPINMERVYEIVVHENSGFTFNILNIIKNYSKEQPTFYFNFEEQYHKGYDLKTKKKMLLNEIIRISNNFEIFQDIEKFFLSKTEGKEEIFSIYNFSELLQIIEDCLLILKKYDTESKIVKFNIVIDDFNYDTSIYQKYLSFKKRDKKKIFYIVKISNECSLALDYFNEVIENSQIFKLHFYRLQNKYMDMFYVPKYKEDCVHLKCNNNYKNSIKLQKIIDLFNYNIVDLFRFKQEIDLFLDEIINYDEFENFIISQYRNDYDTKFRNTLPFLSTYFKKNLTEDENSTNYGKSNELLMEKFLFIPYISIKLIEKKLFVIGPIYKKIINLIITEETELTNLKNKNNYNNNIRYGISFENYLKLFFQYNTGNLYHQKNIKKIFTFSKEIKKPNSINWKLINKVIAKNYDKINLFIIDQKNNNGQYFDLLFLKCYVENNEICVILFFIQISVKKSINDLKKILDSFFGIINVYKIEIEKNNLKFKNAYFFIISSDQEECESLFNYCFNSDLKINIAYDELSNLFYYYPERYVSLRDSKIRQFPEEQNYQQLLTNYIQYESFEKMKKKMIFSDLQLIAHSLCFDRCKIFRYDFNAEFLKKKFGYIFKLKFLIKIKFNKTLVLKSNVFGISNIILIKEHLIENKKNINFLRTKKAITGIKKQVYWIKNKIYDDKGNKINYEGNFRLFQIIS